MKLGLSLALTSSAVIGGSRAPAWVPNGASYYADFVNNRYWKGAVVDFDTATDFTRSTVAEMFDAAGVHSQAAVNGARRNDRGITIEAAAVNICQQSNAPGHANWTHTEFTVGTVGSDGFYPMRETIVSSLHRMFRNTGYSLTTAPATTYTLTWVFRKAGRRYGYFRSNLDGTNRNVGFDLDTVTITTSPFAGRTDTITKVGDVYFLSITQVPTQQFPSLSLGVNTSSVTTDTAPSAYVGDIAQGLDFLNLNIVAASTTQSPVLNNTAGNLSRTADALVLKLPGAATHDVTFIFDDDSQQTVSGVAAGDYSVPTNLNRPQVKSAVWGAV